MRACRRACWDYTGPCLLVLGMGTALSGAGNTPRKGGTLRRAIAAEASTLDLHWAETSYTHSEEHESFHRSTSSAWNRSVGGMVRPSAWAVLRLMTNSNFVGCSTGKSAGLAPCRILPT